jgi:ethanolamine utilization protein EutN
MPGKFYMDVHVKRAVTEGLLAHGARKHGKPRGVHLGVSVLIAKVVGNLVSTIKHPTYTGRKLMLVRPMHLPGEKPEDDFVAVDAAQAGVGDTVLVCQEGNSTRQILGTPNAPIRSSIVAIIDSVSLH